MVAGNKILSPLVVSNRNHQKKKNRGLPIWTLNSSYAYFKLQTYLLSRGNSPKVIIILLSIATYVPM